MSDDASARLAVAAPLLVALLATGACGDGPAEERAATFVGTATCARCHATEAAAWSGSHHDLAMQEASTETVLGDFGGVTFTQRGVAWTFRREGGRFLVRTDGPDGTPADFEVVHTIGVTPLQQYLVRFPDGRLQVLPVAWDTRTSAEGGQRWFHVQPEADGGPLSPFHWTRPSQTANTHCIACHVTGLDQGFDAATRTFRTAWSEIDVSCEACHGPGSRHVMRDGGLATLAREGVWTFAQGASTASLVGASARDRTEVETCAACHARRAPLAAAPATAGAGLHDAWAVALLREGLYHADGQIEDEVYVYGSFVQSRMYAAGVICSDCHEPHGLALRAEGNALCTRCHRADAYDRASHHFHEPGGDGARCVACHMPATTYMVVDPRRDHSLRIPRPEESEAVGAPDACTRCHRDRTAAWAGAALRRWYGAPDRSGGAAAAAPEPHFGRVLHAGRRGDPAAVAGLTALAADTSRPAIVRGTALSLLAAFPSARTAAALGSAFASPEPLVRLGAVQGVGGLEPATAARLAAPRLRDGAGAVRHEAARLLAALPPGSASAETVAMAIDEIERVHAANTGDSGAWVVLGDAYAGQRRIAEAEAAYRTALELDATDLGASLNLADLLRATGRDDEGERVLVAASRFHADTPQLLLATALLRVRQGAAAQAMDGLARAAAAAPGDPRFAYVHAVAVGSGGDAGRALEIIEDALVAHPFDVDLLSGAASYAAQLDRWEAARGYATRLLERAPEDPQAQELAASLLQGRR